jgi:hypothetical protein
MLLRVCMCTMQLSSYAGVIEYSPSVELTLTPNLPLTLGFPPALNLPQNLVSVYLHICAPCSCRPVQVQPRVLPLPCHV